MAQHLGQAHAIESERGRGPIWSSSAAQSWTHSLAMVGLVELIAHIPRIYGEYRKLLAAAPDERPEVAILADPHRRPIQ